MRTIKVEPLGCRLYLYGPEEKEKYEKSFKKIEDSLAEVNGNGVWVGERVESTCYHEAIHLADWIIEDHLGCSKKGNGELRAYLSEWIGSKICAYICGGSNGKGK